MFIFYVIFPNQNEFNNNSSNGFRRLAKHDNPEVVAAILWDWLDHLSQPILSPQDLPLILEHCQSPSNGLKLMEKVLYINAFSHVAAIHIGYLYHPRKLLLSGSEG